MSYRRRSTPLHAARAAAGGAWCLALALVALVSKPPLVLAGVLVAIAGAALAAGVGRELARSARWFVPMGLAIVAINALVARDGLTVVARLGNLPPLGQVDITLEAIAYGGILALRALALVLAFGLYSLAVDPDEVLRAFRRLSFRSALSATLATRMVPVLTRDGRRLAEAGRCRPAGRGPSRLALVRAVSAGALERSVEVAAALELRGYGAARRPPRARRPWSRHDLAFAASAVGLVGLAVAGRGLGWGAFAPYPLLHAPGGAGPVALAVAIPAVALAPFCDRRGIAR